MRHNMPFKLKTIDHTSASGIKDAIWCELKHGLARNAVDVPKPPTPVAAVFGIVFHFFAQNLGEKYWRIISEKGRVVISKDEMNSNIGKARWFLSQTLAEKRGPRGYDDVEPVRIRWFSPKMEAELSPEELEEKKEEKIRYMMGNLSNAIRAYCLQFTLPNKFAEMQFELPFKGQIVGGPVRNLVNALTVKLDGFIDWVRVLPNFQFEVYDFKTGYVVNDYKKRINIVDDLQMTIYDYVCRQIYQAPPTAMYIQPMDGFSTKFLQKYGEYTMEKLRIPVDPVPRTQTHFQELEAIAADVFEMSNMVANAYFYTPSQLNDWQPSSNYGKKVGFERNVRELRYIPRIGPGCETCQFLGLCQKICADDWKEYARKHGSLDSELVVDSFLPEPKEPPAPPAPRLIQDFAPKRSEYVKKPDRVIKNEMLQTKQFVPVKTLPKSKHRTTTTGLVPFINQLVVHMRSLGDCPCLKHKLFPIHVVPHLDDLYFQRISLNKVLQQCPHEGCPRRNKKEQLG
jgi:hypothetical protein